MRWYAMCIGVVLLFGCNNRKKNILIDTIPVAAMQEDIAFLKKLVYSAHAGAFAYNSQEQLDRFFDSLTASIDAPATLADFYNKVECVTERMRCLHTITSFPDEFYDSIREKPLFFPISLVAIENKLYVNSSRYSIPLGAEIIGINDNKAADIIRRLQPYAHIDGLSKALRSQAIDENFAMNYFLAFGANEKFRVQYYDSASGKSGVEMGLGVKLSTVSNDWYADTHYFIPTDANYDFEMDDKLRTGILTIRTFDFSTYATSSAYEHFLANSFRLMRQSGMKNLVIDCRNNGGGRYTCAYTLLSYLHPKILNPFDSVTRRFTRLPYASYVVEEDTVRAGDEDLTDTSFNLVRDGIYQLKSNEIDPIPVSDLLFRGSVFLLVNDGVASAAADFAAILKEQPNVYVVGEETAGGYNAHNSYVFTYQLPNSRLKVDIPTRRYYQPIHAKDIQCGVTPHKRIGMTVADLVDFRDRAMDFVKDSLLKN